MKSLILRPAIGTCLVLLIPLTMTLVDRHKAQGEGWNWGPGDFMVMGTLLLGAGLCYEFFAERLTSSPHRVALGLTIIAAVLAIWVEMAVGGVSQLVAWGTSQLRAG